MKNPLISIIVPVYQVESCLAKCIDSICRQTYRNIEIILIDDGSTDRSGAICDEYAQVDKRIRAIHQRNKGLSAARNNGIEASSGDYMTFVDADDVLLHGKYLELLLEALISEKAQISMCGQIEFVKGPRPDYRIDYDATRVISGRDILSQKKGIYGCCYWNVLAKLFERRVFDNIRFPEGHILEDTAILHRLLLPIKTISLLGIRMYGKYIRQESIMHTLTPHERFLDSMYAFNDRIRYYHDMDEPELEERAHFEKTGSKAIYYLRCKEAGVSMAENLLPEDQPSLADLKRLYEIYFPESENHIKKHKKRKIVLHIGQTKTGSSAIQGFMRNNEKLLESQGICFYRPVEFAVSDYRNANFVLESALSKAGFPIDELADSQIRLEKWLFAEYAKPYDTLILSDEIFWNRGIDVDVFWQSIRSFFEELFGKDIDFRIIVFLRRQDDWVYSYWKEQIRSMLVPEKRSFQRYMEDICQAGFLDYNYGLKLLKESFGKESISVVPYLYGTEGNEIINDFCNLAGIPIYEDFVFQERRINESITGEMALAVQLITRGEIECHSNMRMIKRVAGMLSGFYPETEPSYPLPSEERERLLERYKEGNRAVAREYLGCEDLFNYEFGEYLELTSNPERDRKNAQKIIDLARIIPVQDGFRKNGK